MGECFSTIDPELMHDVEQAVHQFGATIPSTYKNEKHRIIEEMRQAAPKPYNNLLYADYPAKNEKDVNLMACKKIGSNDAKKVVVNQIKEKIQPKIDEKLSNSNPIQRAAVSKAVDAAIERLVDNVIKAFIKNVNDNVEQSKTKV